MGIRRARRGTEGTVATSGRSGVTSSGATSVCAVVSAVMAITGTALSAEPARAQSPVGGAVIEVRTGGARTESGSVGGLDGVVLGIVPDDGDGKLSDAEFAATPAATCTSAGGLCTFTVSGADLDRRYWVMQDRAPAGWTVNRRLRTGPASGGAGSAATDYAFLTPVVRNGQTYTSGDNGDNGFMSGAETLNGRYTDSTGTWQQSRVNPTLPANCGLRVALVIDWSTSVGGAENNLRTAADSLVDGLAGTSSSMAVFNFSTTSPISAKPNAPDLTPVSTGHLHGHELGLATSDDPALHDPTAEHSAPGDVATTDAPVHRSWRAPARTVHTRQRQRCTSAGVHRHRPPSVGNPERHASRRRHPPSRFSAAPAMKLIHLSDHIRAVNAETLI